MIAKFVAQRINLQQIFTQKWIKENFFDMKQNEILKDKIKIPKTQCSSAKLSEKEKFRKHSSKKDFKKGPINSVF